MMLDNLAFSRFKAVFRVGKTIELPPYTGSMFRGIIGKSLGNVRYGLNPDGCPNCRNRSECRYGNLYAYLFESPADHPFIAAAVDSLALKQKTYPQPFIIEPPKGGHYPSGDYLTLPFTLVGKAVTFLPFMACAMKLISEYNKLYLEGIVDGFISEDKTEQLIYNGKIGHIVGSGQLMDFDLIDQWCKKQIELNPINKIRIRFITPFRFKSGNHLKTYFNFKELIKNIFRRIVLLSVHSPLLFTIEYKPLLELAEQVVTEKSNLRWFDWQRFSNRQKTQMKLGGLIGEIVFAGDLNKFLPYIKLCEFLNVGKGGTFGLGKFEMRIL